MPESFASGSPLPHSKNSAASNSLLAPLPASLVAFVDIAHYAAFLHTHNPSAAPAQPDPHPTSKALGKNWRRSESFDTKKFASFTLVGKGDKNPLGSSIQAF